jgi:outer membrane lipoprotein-sorting protein
MKSKMAIFCTVWACCLAALAQTGTLPATGDLQSVLNDMDRAAAGFKSAQADFVWDQYTKVVNEHDQQKGVIYYRRQANEVQMAANISSPAVKQVLFTGGKVDVCQPEIAQATEYNAGKDKGTVESFLVLGFGGRGRDLPKSFDVTLGGWETVNGIRAAQLTLVPKSPKVRGMFSEILLWIDPARGISVQQKLIEPSGAYRLAKYSNIKLNQNLPGDVFKLNPACKKIVKPQG